MHVDATALRVKSVLFHLASFSLFCKLFFYSLLLFKMTILKHEAHITPSMQYGQYLTHAYSHITQAVAAMGSCFILDS